VQLFGDGVDLKTQALQRSDSEHLSVALAREYDLDVRLGSVVSMVTGPVFLRTTFPSIVRNSFSLLGLEPISPRRFPKTHVRIEPVSTISSTLRSFEGPTNVKSVLVIPFD